MDEKQDENGKESDEEKEDAKFLDYGSSIENFFNLEWMLMKAFVMLTILCITQLVSFGLNWNLNKFGDGTFLSGISFAGLG